MRKNIHETNQAAQLLLNWHSYCIVVWSWNHFYYNRPTTFCYCQLWSFITVHGQLYSNELGLYCQVTIWPSKYERHQRLLPYLYFSFVRVMRFVINRKYAFFCMYLVGMWHDHHKSYLKAYRWPSSVINHHDWQFGKCPEYVC